MTREDTHKALLLLHERAAKQPISYIVLFREAADIAASLLHELCEADANISALQHTLTSNYADHNSSNDTPTKKGNPNGS